MEKKKGCGSGWVKRSGWSGGVGEGDKHDQNILYKNFQ